MSSGRQGFERRKQERAGLQKALPKWMPKGESNAKCPDCGAPWEPICPSRGCQGRSVPLSIIREERRG